MKQKGYQTNAEYIESMMKQFKLVDMREQYRDLILEAESSAMDYESFLVRLLSVEEEGKRGRRTEKLRREFTSGVAPCVFLPSEGVENFIYMVLPVRLKAAN